MGDLRRLPFERMDVTDDSSETEMGVPKRAEESELSSTTTLARLGNVERGVEGLDSEGSGVVGALLSARRNGDRVRVLGRRRKVAEYGREGRLLRPVGR